MKAHDSQQTNGSALENLLKEFKDNISNEEK